MPVGQFGQQARRTPVVAELRTKSLNLGIHCIQANLIGGEHRAAAVGRKPVTVEIDDVDVARPGRDALRKS